MLTNNRYSLCGDWTLYYVENKRFNAEKIDVSTITAVKNSGWDSVPAVVPGNFERDFERAGLIGDTYFGTNALDNYRFEATHLIYYRNFIFDGQPDENTVLRFDGIDTIADIYVNGKLIGQADNMLIPHEFTDANIRHGENEIVIHITPSHIAARSKPLPICTHAHTHGYDVLNIRKAAHTDGWDIMPRIISGGIWRPCWVEQKKPDRINDVFCYVHSINLANNHVVLKLQHDLTVEGDDLSEYSMDVRGICDEHSFNAHHSRVWHTSDAIYCSIDNCKLWWPRNYGEPNLYHITVTLNRCGKPVFDYSFRYGIRTVRLDRTSVTDEAGNGEFCFYINEKKIFWMGTNWVPVNAFHSEDAATLPQVLPMLTDIGCNCVRCWGGNIYEDDIFYDFCDENGIMIWQDFSNACGIHPQTKEYCDLFRVEVDTIIKRLRNHSSIVIWAGDNEVDGYFSWSGSWLDRNPNSNMLTRRVIPDSLLAHDFTRPYLPSSPYWDETAYKTKKPISEQHLWGPRDYFKGSFYKGSLCHFASETGYHGCPSPDSLKKFIHEDQLWPWRSAPDSDVPKPDWGLHSSSPDVTPDCGNIYRIRLMTNQVKTLFGHDFENLYDYARASQISQAEAKKYFIERFRVTKWRRTGIIWWNLLDGWPQISDAVVDWYHTKKLAYHYIKRSQQPICMIFDEPDGDQLPLHIVSDLQYNVNVEYTVTDLTDGKELISSNCVALNNTSRRVWLKQMLPDEKHFYYIKWEYTDNNGKKVTCVNHYMTNIIDIDYDEYIDYMKQVRYYDEFEGFGE